MPSILARIILRYFLAERRSWFPDGGYIPLTTNPAQWFYHLLLPWFTLAPFFSSASTAAYSARTS